MQPQEFRAPLKLEALLGTNLTAYAQDSGYWHLFVALRTTSGPSVVFTSEEQSAGFRFEVFPIRFSIEEEGTREWHVLQAPFLVGEASPLWRSEWVEARAVGPTLGSDPNTQYAGRGPVPSKALSSARVLAGVLLESASGQRMVIAASNSAPFNIEIAASVETVETALEGFENVSPNPSIERTA